MSPRISGDLLTPKGLVSSSFGESWPRKWPKKTRVLVDPKRSKLCISSNSYWICSSAFEPTSWIFQTAILKNSGPIQKESVAWAWCGGLWLSTDGCVVFFHVQSAKNWKGTQPQFVTGKHQHLSPLTMSIHVSATNLRRIGSERWA